MAFKQLTAGLLAMSIAGIASAAATPLNTTLEGVFNNLATDGNNDVNVYTDMISDDLDALWTLNGSGLGSTTMIIELAGYAGSNKFGIYADGEYVQLFNGSASAGAQAVLKITGDGSVIVNFADTGIDFDANKFGFYLDSPDGMFHSDTDLNGDGTDHMLAYQGIGEQVDLDGAGTDFIAGPWGSNEYILAWEDLAGGGDRDYADMVVMIESITPIPEPGLAALLGAGLVGLGLSRRKSQTA